MPRSFAKDFIQEDNSLLPDVNREEELKAGEPKSLRETHQAFRFADMFEVSTKKKEPTVENDPDKIMTDSMYYMFKGMRMMMKIIGGANGNQ